MPKIGNEPLFIAKTKRPKSYFIFSREKMFVIGVIDEHAISGKDEKLRAGIQWMNVNNGRVPGGTLNIRGFPTIAEAADVMTGISTKYSVEPALKKDIDDNADASIVETNFLSNIQLKRLKITELTPDELDNLIMSSQVFNQLANISYKINDATNVLKEIQSELHTIEYKLNDISNEPGLKMSAWYIDYTTPISNISTSLTEIVKFLKKDTITMEGATTTNGTTK